MHRSIALLLLCFILPALTHCAKKSQADGPPLHYVDVSTIKDPTPKKEALSHYGNPESYVIQGRRYQVLKSSENYHREGIASWYGRKFNGRLTSTREIYDMLAMTAASPVLPLPSYVRVTNLDNHRHVVVRVNDRGPFHPGRILDLSYAAAAKLDMLKKGTARVRVETITLTNPLAPPSYYVQAAAFNEGHHAQQLAKQLEALLNNPVRILTIHPSQNTTTYRVQVGPLSSLAQTQQIQRQLEKINIVNSFVNVQK